jgi:hypothetical protein
MAHQHLLTLTSLRAVTLFTLHWSDEIARGLEAGTTAAIGGFAILFVWLYATRVALHRRWGLIIVLLGALLASAVPILHMQGAGLVGKRLAVDSRGAFFWVWTNIALGLSGMISPVESARTTDRVKDRRAPTLSANRVLAVVLSESDELNDLQRGGHSTSPLPPLLQGHSVESPRGVALDFGRTRRKIDALSVGTAQGRC